MENEENRGLIHKKAYEDQYTKLFQFSLELSHYFLSLSYSWILRVFLEHSWRVCHTFIFGARRQRKSRKVQEDIKIRNYIIFFLQVLGCMYVFLTSFGMHGICMWFIGHDLSLAWRMAWIDSVFSQPCHFLDNHGDCGFISLFCFFWFSCFLSLA